MYKYMVRLLVFFMASFEWDEAKNISNIKKHGVSFYRVIAEDLEHSAIEKRYYCFGKLDEHVMTVRFTYRRKVVRIIGAGYWRKGGKIYENKKEI